MELVGSSLTFKYQTRVELTDSDSTLAYYDSELSMSVTNIEQVPVTLFHLTFSHGACIINLFVAVIYGYLQSARVFVLGKNVQPSLMFVGKGPTLQWST